MFHGHIIHTIEDAIPLAPHCKILILRIDKFGDMIVTIPIIREIRKKFPHATIDVILGKSNKSLTSNALMYANSVLYYDKTLFGLIKLLYRIRKSKYDICIDPLDNPSITSGNICYLSNAMNTVGLYKSNAKKYTHCIVPKDRMQVHIVERTAQILLAFGIDPEVTTLDCEFHLEASIIEHTINILRDTIDLHKPVIAVNTTGSVSSRTMSEHFALKLYEELIVKAQMLNAQVLFFGPESEKEKLQSLQKSTGCLIAPFSHSFNEYAAMLKCASLIISPDTSAVHLAASWKRSIICLFCNDNTGTALWTPYKTLHEAVVSSTYSINDIEISNIIDSIDNICTKTPLLSAEELLHS
jgi:ADP-heptose:LPS heptosyltransferase